jgi:hypothetical protein
MYPNHEAQMPKFPARENTQNTPNPAKRTLILPNSYIGFYKDIGECVYCSQTLRHEMHAYNHFVRHHYTPEMFPECEKKISERSETLKQQQPAQEQRYFIWDKAAQQWIEVYNPMALVFAFGHNIPTAYTKR